MVQFREYEHPRDADGKFVPKAEAGRIAARDYDDALMRGDTERASSIATFAINKIPETPFARSLLEQAHGTFATVSRKRKVRRSPESGVRAAQHRTAPKQEVQSTTSHEQPSRTQKTYPQDWRNTSIEVADLPQGVVAHDRRSASIPAGRYFVGDPVYLAGSGGQDAWDDLCEKINADGERDKRSVIGGVTMNGVPVIVADTAYGDGTFYDEKGNAYSVDSGLLSVIPVEMAEHLRVPESELKDSGRIVDVPAPVKMSYDDFDEGTIRIGGIEIITGDGADDSNDDSEEYTDYLDDDDDSLLEDWDSDVFV